jgi:hypothetical protein
MAVLGQLKAPVLPLEKAYSKAMDLIDSYDEGCAIAVSSPANTAAWYP